MSAGHVGPPLVSALIKLVDVPDMNYFASEGEGEVRRTEEGFSILISSYNDLTDLYQGAECIPGVLQG